MGKILITSNWEIGNDLHSNTETFKYLNNILLKYIETNLDKNDTCIILGNTLSKPDLIKTNELLSLYDILNSISEKCNVYILIGKNDLHKKKSLLDIFSKNSNINIIADSKTIKINDKYISLIPYKGIYVNEPIDMIFSHDDIETNSLCFTAFNNTLNKNGKKINVPSPYQLSKKDDINKGFFVYDSNLQFIKNAYTPLYKNIIIKTEEDIDNVITATNGNDKINLVVDESLLSKGNIIKQKINKIIDDKLVDEVKYTKDYISLSKIDVDYDVIINASNSVYDELIENSITPILNDDEYDIFKKELTKLKLLADL